MVRAVLVIMRENASPKTRFRPYLVEGDSDFKSDRGEILIRLQAFKRLRVVPKDSSVTV